MLKILALVIAFGVVATGCGGGDDNPEAQPAPDVTVFRGGVFDQLPRYPRSVDLATPTETAGVVAQTFSVRNASPREILDFYASRLDRWRVVEPVHQVGDDAFRGSWTRDGRRLQVSAGRAPAIDVEPPTVEPPIAQYSLQLGPPEAFPS
ncbi:MAG: hypothetical protein ACLGI2_00245 [Acidimicrobiia bacterium]